LTEILGEFVVLVCAPGHTVAWSCKRSGTNMPLAAHCPEPIWWKTGGEPSEWLAGVLIGIFDFGGAVPSFRHCYMSGSLGARTIP